MDTLITTSSEIKSLGGGKFAGYLVRFSDETQPDLAGDFFTAETDFGMETGEVKTSPVYYNHGLDATLKTRKIGTANLTLKDAGVWMEGEIAKADAYNEAVIKLLDANVCGSSSGTASHLVEREASGKAFHIKHWPLGLDASITVEPCDPYNHVVSIKSIEGNIKSIPDLLKELEASGAIKASSTHAETPFVTATADIVTAGFERLYSRLSSFLYQELYGDDWMCSRYSDSSQMSPAEPIDRMAIETALNDFSSHVLTVLDALLARGSSVTTAETKSFLSLFKPTEASEVADSLNAMPLKTYLLTMRRAVCEDLPRRLDFVANESASAKSGRVLSQDNHAALNDICSGMESHTKRLRDMLDRHAGKSATPKAEDATNPQIQEASHALLQSAYQRHVNYTTFHGGTVTL
jgi:hypothetical protein